MVAKSEVLEKIVDETMKVLSEKKFLVDNGPRVRDHRVVSDEKTVRRFITLRLFEDGTSILFKGEYFYAPENWKTETPDQIRKIVNFVVYKNIAY